MIGCGGFLGRLPGQSICCSSLCQGIDLVAAGTVNLTQRGCSGLWFPHWLALVSVNVGRLNAYRI